MKKIIITMSLLTMSILNANTSYESDMGGCPNGGVYREDYLGFYKCECTSYVAWKISKEGTKLRNNGMEVNGVWKNIRSYLSHEGSYKSRFSNAQNWDNAVNTIGVPYDNTPHIGDIAVWEKGRSSVGHVAYVESVSNGVITVSEYNYNNKHKPHTTRTFNINKEYNRFSNDKANHYIHVKVNNLTVYDFWIKQEIVYTDSKFDAQFKLKNNSSQTMDISAIALSLHDVNNNFVKDMKLEHGIYIQAGKSYKTIPFYTIQISNPIISPICSLKAKRASTS